MLLFDVTLTVALTLCTPNYEAFVESLNVPVPISKCFKQSSETLKCPKLIFGRVYKVSYSFQFCCFNVTMNCVRWENSPAQQNIIRESASARKMKKKIWFSGSKIWNMKMVICVWMYRLNGALFQTAGKQIRDVKYSAWSVERLSWEI